MIVPMFTLDLPVTGECKGFPSFEFAPSQIPQARSQHVTHVGGVGRIRKDGVPESLCRYVRSDGKCEHVYQLVGLWSQEMGTQDAISIFVDQHFEARAILCD